MRWDWRFSILLTGIILFPGWLRAEGRPEESRSLGREVAIARHWQKGEEYAHPLREVIEYGKRLFTANWTVQEGAGRPGAKGTSSLLTDGQQPLVFPRNFNRLSGPDANSCAGCHNAPFGIPGGGGDIVTNVFVMGQRFDFVSFDATDGTIGKESRDEHGTPITLHTVGNFRATLGLLGAGYIEMLARQMTEELRVIRDSLQPGQACTLVAKGVTFGILARHADGTWDTSRVEGIPFQSLITKGNLSPPSLIIRPFHQSGSIVSLRQFTTNAFNHHHGMQAVERFGVGTDHDNDGFSNELTQADITAVTLYQATLAVPGRVIPKDAIVERAVWLGEQRFSQIGCAACHVPQLPLIREGWIFTEPSIYNPPGNLRPSTAPTDPVSPITVDLTSELLPLPRLKLESGVVAVPAYTDLKLHDITTGSGDPNEEPLDINRHVGTPEFFAGNRKFLTRRLWGAANEPPYFHHGKFTTLREAILAHAGEALSSRTAFTALPTDQQDAMIEFLKTLQVLPPGTPHLIVDEQYQKRRWPPLS